MDLTPLTNWLQSLGTVGYLIAAAIPVIVYFLKQKYGPTPTPVTPTPDPSPATISPRLDAVAPLLNALLAALGLAPKGRPATVADVPHDFHLQVSNEWDKVNAIKSAQAEKMVADLAVPVPAAVAPATYAATAPVRVSTAP